MACIREYPPGLFLKAPSSHPSSKRLESRREAEPPLSPLEVLFVCLLYNRSQLTRKRSKAVGCGKQQMHKKIRILQKLTCLSAKRGIFCPFFSISLHGPYRKRISHTETTDIFVPATSWKWHSTRPHSYLLCLSSLRRSRDIYLSYYLSILYIYIIHLFIFIFIFRRPPCAVRFRLRFLILETPAT